MRNSLAFSSTCPACGQQRLQQGHTRRALIGLIESRQIIDAYCFDCDMVWPVSTGERVVIARAIAIGQGGTMAVCMTEPSDTRGGGTRTAPVAA
jgi:hypothetical protein